MYIFRTYTYQITVKVFFQKKKYSVNNVLKIWHYKNKKITKLKKNKSDLTFNKSESEGKSAYTLYRYTLVNAMQSNLYSIF